MPRLRRRPPRVGAVPDSTAPSSLTLSPTASAAAVSPVLLSVNEAAVPSVTGDVPAAIDTLGVAGPGTLTETGSESASPSGVQIAPASLQALVVAGSVIVTALLPDGRILKVHRSNAPGSTRRLPRTAPPVTSRASWIAWFLLNGSLPSNTASLNASSSVNALLPSCDAGTDWNSAVSPAGAGVTESEGSDAAPFPSEFTARSRNL